MKRLFNYLVLLIICLLPVVVNAEVEYEFDWQKDDQMFLYEEDGLYYFVDDILYNLEDVKLYAYNENGVKKSERYFYNPDEMTESEFYSSKDYASMIPYWRHEDNVDLFFDEDNRMFYEVYYSDEIIYGYDYNTNENIEFSFSENLELTEEILGERLNVYNSVKNNDLDVLKIDIFDTVNVVYYMENHDIQVYILDKNNNPIIEYNSGLYNYSIYEKDGVIYFPEFLDDETSLLNKISLYKLDGTKLGDLVIDNDYFDKDMYDYCGGYNLARFEVDDNYLIVVYEYEGCPVRREMSSVEDYVKEDAGYPYMFAVKYSLAFDVETVESSNGELTYEPKVDEDGKSYVELKIIPKDGYSVKEIIVTDSNGNRIEVTNNKFYMPMNDVKVEVKYVLGEYLPIPDTFLSKSVSLILIGLILVGLGFYTINYVRNDRKVDI